LLWLSKWDVLISKRNKALTQIIIYEWIEIQLKEINEAYRGITFLGAVENFGQAYNNILNSYKLILELEILLEE